MLKSEISYYYPCIRSTYLENFILAKGVNPKKPGLCLLTFPNMFYATS